MRVTFYRLADHEWAQILIERDDGVVYRMHGGPVTAELPHDLVHYTVEDALALADGIWGAIAGGVVFQSMKHVSGRRPPHAAERSAALIRQYRDRLQRAELLGGFVEAAAKRPDADLPALVAATFSTRPLDLPKLDGVAGAIAALRRAEENWRKLTVGARMELTWPAHRRISASPIRRTRDKAGARRHR
jgi:hypothetical protein